MSVIVCFCVSSISLQLLDFTLCFFVSLYLSLSASLGTAFEVILPQLQQLYEQIKASEKPGTKSVEYIARKEPS